MSYILKSGNQYIKVKHSKPTIVAELKNATKYGSYDQADNFIRNHIRPDERNRYEIVKYAPEKPPSLSSLITKPKPVVKSQPTEIVVKTDIVSDLKDVQLQVTTKFHQRKTALHKEIERCDNIILDIRHFARDGTTRLNACQAAKAFYKQQEIERQRLQAKMELNRINAVEEFINNAIETADTFDYSDYKPREIKDIITFLGI